MNSNWTNMMWDAESAVGHWAIIYYVSWNIIGRQVLLNLFLAILIDNFTVSQCSHRLSQCSANFVLRSCSKRSSCCGICALTAVPCTASVSGKSMAALEASLGMAATPAHVHQLWGLLECLVKQTVQPNSLCCMITAPPALTAGVCRARSVSSQAPAAAPEGPLQRPQHIHLTCWHRRILGPPRKRAWRIPVL